MIVILCALLLYNDNEFSIYVDKKEWEARLKIKDEERMKFQKHDNVNYSKRYLVSIHYEILNIDQVSIKYWMSLITNHVRDLI